MPGDGLRSRPEVQPLAVVLATLLPYLLGETIAEPIVNRLKKEGNKVKKIVQFMLILWAIWFVTQIAAIAVLLLV